MKLESVRAVVTGAAGGLGRVFCRHLLASGAKVLATDFDGKQLADMQAASSALHVHTGDISKESDVVELFKKARAEMGGCNVLINNAGILRDRALVKKDKSTGLGVRGMSKDEWDSVLAVNLTGPFLAAREFAAGAIGFEKNGGVIVNISSSARNGYVFQSNYSAAKAGIASDTVVWAKELAKYQIRCGAVAPGVIHTKILDSVPQELLDDLISKVALKRLGHADEIWQGVKFIIECEYFTGRVLEIDGGITL